MTKLNNIPILDYGLKLIAFQGVLDMSKRTGQLVYNWGDELQPIIADLSWDAHEFSMKAFFDNRLIADTLDQTVNNLKALGSCTLTTDYGDFNVEIKEIRDVKTYGDHATLTIAFYARNYMYQEDLGTATGGDFTINGFDLKTDLGVDVVRVGPIEQAGELFLSAKTVYKTPQHLTSLRQFRRLSIDCAIVFSTANEAKISANKLKTLLTSEGLKELTFNGNSHDVYFTEGIKFSFAGNSLKFKLPLWIVSLDSSSLHALQYLIAYSKQGTTWERVECTAESIRKLAGIRDGADALYFNYKAYSIINDLTWESPQCTYNSIP